MVKFATAVQKLLAKVGLASSGSTAQTQREFQHLNTGLGAAFGQSLSNQDLLFAAKREPVAHFLTFIVGHDVFDKWFILEPLRDSRMSAEKFDERAMNVLDDLKAKGVFTQAAVYERIFGWSIIVIGYEDQAEKLKEEVKGAKQIDDLEAYSPMQIVNVDLDEDENSKRFGQPVIYKLQRSETKQTEVHFSRVIHLATRKDQPGYKGFSVLEPIWDDATAFRNCRWGMGQNMVSIRRRLPGSNDKRSSL